MCGNILAMVAFKEIIDQEMCVELKYFDVPTV